MGEAKQVIARNKKAFHDYFVLDTYEAGLELFGETASELGSFGRMVVSGEAFGSERGAAVMAGLGAVPKGLAEK